MKQKLKTQDIRPGLKKKKKKVKLKGKKTERGVMNTLE